MSKVEVQLPDEAPRNPKLQIVNLEKYEDAIHQFRQQLAGLVERNSMSEQVAAKILAETEYSFFQQFIEITYY